MIPSISPFWGRKCSILCGLFLSGAISLVAQSCLIICDPMDCSTPGLPVHHQFRELAQTHIHRVGDAIQPSHHLSSPSPPAFNLSQHQGLFQWVSSSHQVAKVVKFQLQHQSSEYSGLISFRINWFDLLFGGLYTEIVVLLEPSSGISLMKPQPTCERKKQN